jgi:hypothetical protein
MGFRFYDLASLPQQYDVVWCLYPRREDKLAPGPTARPTLVLDVQVNAELKVARLLVAYGTGEFDEGMHRKIDLIIDDWDEVRALGLHKPTRFALSAQSRMLLPWCVEYFVPPSYLAQCGIIAGALTAEQIGRLTECLAARGLKPLRRGE